MSASNVLARLFGRSKHPVVSSLATAALNRPLLAHPAMAEALIGAYLSGTTTSADTLLQTEVVPVTAAELATEVARVGVINITGGLVNRPMPGPSGGGPVSYAAIGEEFDALMANDSVTAIVLRIESPGGMASGCFDLTDHIFANRGKKPIHALVDDYAHSGAYAIAAACDRIWVSRTGTVGSIGVVGFHYDWSENNAKVGLKVTPIFAGAHKVDFNPNFPLSEEALARATAQTQVLYEMFVGSVAKYRGVDVEAIRSTEADIFQGQQALDAGLATDLGTWDDLMSTLGIAGVDAPDQPGSDEDDGEELESASSSSVAGAELPAGEGDDAAPAALAVVLDPQQVRLLERGAMLETVTAAKLPPLVTVALVETVAAGEDVAARIAHAQEVISLCQTAKADDKAASFVRANTKIQQVRSALVEAKASADETITLQTHLPANGAAKSGAGNALDPYAIYQKRGI